jgi:stage II sporulation protein P
LLKRAISLFIMCIMSFFLPQVAETEMTGPHLFCQKLVTVIAPVFSYNEETIAKETLLASQAELENKRAAEKAESKTVANADETGTDGQSGTVGENSLIGADVWSGETGLSETNDAMEEKDSNAAADEMISAGDTETAEESVLEDSADPVGDSDASNSILMEKLKDFDYLVQNYYIVDSSTTIRSEDLNAEELLTENLAVDKTADGPQILIYHTHSQEGYQDSTEGDESTSVMALGETLAQLLTEQYGFRVLHHTGKYDVDDRDHAYSNAAPAIQQILEENPTIEVVIDLHRDSVPEDNRLVTTVNGKPTAKIMFFNGLCRTTASGDLTRLQNPYLKDNLAFSLQMQLAAAEKFPDLTRKIYLKGYRYNMHFCPKSLLVEVGAQNNTFEEAENAMEPLAELLAEVLQ